MQKEVAEENIVYCIYFFSYQRNSGLLLAAESDLYPPWVLNKSG